MSFSKNTFRYFIFGTALLTLGYQLACRFYLTSHAALPGHHHFEITGVRPQLIDESITPAIAKHRHEWWINRRYTNSGDGAGLKLLDSESLFSSTFPGYPDRMRHDSQLWGRYFQHPFDGDIWLPGIVDRNEFQLHSSWLGCSEIYRRYGADVIILGNSETFLGLVPKVISDFMPASKKRVLLCGRNALLPDSIAEFVKYLSQFHLGGPKPTVILGYSQMWAYPESYFKSLDRDSQERDLRDFISHENPVYHWLTFRARDAWLPPTWEQWLPVKLSDLRPSEPTRELATDVDATVNYLFGFSFNRRDLKELPRILKRISLDYAPTRHSYGVGCLGLSSPTRRLQETVLALKSFSEKVFIFQTPTTAWEVEKASPCLQTYMDRILQSQRDATVRTRVTRTAEYGLDWNDFVKPGETSSLMWLDLNHLNFEGALKLSSKIGQWVSEKTRLP